MRASKNSAADKWFLRAAQENNLAQMRAALQAGANVNAYDGYDQTALMYQCLPPYVGGGNLESVQFLLASGANPNLRNSKNGTPLMMAAASGWEEIVELLVRHGASVEAKSKEGKSALMYAARGVTAENGVPLSSPNIVRFLLRRGAKVNESDADGATALIQAASIACYEDASCRRDMTETARVLLQHGANVNLSTRNGNTALKWARLRKHRAMEKMLLRAGARK